MGTSGNSNGNLAAYPGFYNTLTSTVIVHDLVSRVLMLAIWVLVLAVLLLLGYSHYKFMRDDLERRIRALKGFDVEKDLSSDIDKENDQDDVKKQGRTKYMYKKRGISGHITTPIHDRKHR